MFLEPRGHVRQRSFAKSEKQEPQDVEPLLDESKDAANVSILFQRRSTSTAALAILWVASLALASLCTYVLTRTSSTSSLGSFAAGYKTELGGS